MAAAAGIAGIGMTLAGAGVQAAGNVQMLETRAEAAQYNSEIAQQNSALALQQSQEQARRVQIAGERAIGGIQAATGASGITNEGSPMTVLQSSAQNAELDRLTTLYTGQVKSQSYQSQANLYDFEAQAARSQEFYGAAAPILSGLGSAFRQGATL